MSESFRVKKVWDVSLLQDYLQYVPFVVQHDKIIKMNVNLGLAQDIALLLLACELTDI